MLLPSLGLTHNLVLLCLARHTTEDDLSSDDWHLYSNNLYTKFSVRDSNPQPNGFGGVTGLRPVLLNHLAKHSSARFASH